MSDHVIFRRQALADGFTDSEIRRARDSGRLVRIAAGAYVPDEHFAALDAPALHRARIAAAVQSRPPGVVVSHTSAALLHGMDLGDLPLERVHLTRNHASGGGRTTGVHVHATPLDAPDVVTLGGLAVTSPARTVVDTARISTFDQAVVVGDSALHRRLVALDEILDEVGRAGPRKGLATARRAASFLDGRSESPGESLSRIRIRQHDLPSPELQHVLHDGTGTFLGRVDFFWREFGVVGEFDGLGKYGVDGGQAAVAVHREKLREDAIRDARSSGGRGGTCSTSLPSRCASTGLARVPSTGADRRLARHSPDSGAIAPDSGRRCPQARARGVQARCKGWAASSTA
jgi:hypothetical protein